MGKETEISWCDSTFNPWWGCEKPLVQIGGKEIVSPECVSCYAEKLDARWGGKHWGRTAPRRCFGDKHWREPLKWNQEAAEAGRRWRVFCLSMGDILEDRRDLDDHRRRLCDLIPETPWLDWMLLTKRSDLFQILIPGWVWRLPNVWPGVTAGCQATANIRVPDLVGLKLAYPHLVAWVSCEPMLEPINWKQAAALYPPYFKSSPINLIIFGGESGPRSRRCDIAWILDGVRQCRSAGIHPFVKQFGANVTGPEQSVPGWVSELNAKGSNIEVGPLDLQVREIPEVRCGV